jgi:hypothetical protein
MKLIPLTRGLSAMVDEEDYEYLMQWKWCAVKGKHTYYGYRNGLIGESIDGKRHCVSIHKAILDRVISQPDGKPFIDHKDGNGLNNTKENLRYCTRQENGRNRKSWGGSKYLGVNKRSNGTYQTSIMANNRNKTKTFKTEVEAALYYNELAKIHHGEFARLNII